MPRDNRSHGMKTLRAPRLLAVLVVALTALLAVQTYRLYRLNRKPDTVSVAETTHAAMPGTEASLGDVTQPNGTMPDPGATLAENAEDDLDKLPRSD